MLYRNSSHICIDKSKKPYCKGVHQKTVILDQLTQNDHWTMTPDTKVSKFLPEISVEDVCIGNSTLVQKTSHQIARKRDVFRHWDHQISSNISNEEGDITRCAVRGVWGLSSWRRCRCRWAAESHSEMPWSQKALTCLLLCQLNLVLYLWPWLWISMWEWLWHLNFEYAIKTWSVLISSLTLVLSLIRLWIRL